MMLKLVYYVPESHLEITKHAVFEMGAGRTQHYQQCCWQTKGMGQFKPVEGAQPYTGQINQLEQLEEWRVEMMVDEAHAHDVKQALLNSHPYEEPAFEFIQIINL